MTTDPLGLFRDQLVEGVRGDPRRRRRRAAAVAGAAAALVIAAGAVAVSAGGSGDQQVTADSPTSTTTAVRVPGHPSTRAGPLGARRLAGAPAGRRLVRHPGSVDPAAVGRVEPHAPQERVVERGLPRRGRRGEARGVGHLAPARRPVRPRGAGRVAGHQRLHPEHRLVHDRLGDGPDNHRLLGGDRVLQGPRADLRLRGEAAAGGAPTTLGCR